MSRRAIVAGVLWWSRRASATLGLAALVCAGGCSLTIDTPPTVENTCSSQHPCASGECTGGMCVTPAIDKSMRVSFEVVPPRDEPGLLSAIFLPETVAGAGTRDLALPSPVVLRGGAYAGETDTRIPVQLTFTPRPAFAGAPASFVRVLVGSGDFAITLEEGRVYDVLVEPSTVPDSTTAGIDGADPMAASDLYPPLYLEGLVPDQVASDGVLGRLEIRYPADLAEPCTLVRTSACTLAGKVLGQDADGDSMPEPGLRVRAVTPDGRVVSTSALTDDDGACAIRITPEVDAYSLSITVPDASGELPDILAPVDLATSIADRVVLVPRLEPVTLMGLVGYLVGQVPQPVGGAAISFESTALVDLDLDLGGAITFRRSAITASAEPNVGQFEIALLPGTYRVVVTPTELDAAGVLVTQVTIDVRSAGSVIMGQLYSLPRRARYSGEIITPAGEPVPQPTLRARRLPAAASVPADDVLRFGRSSETTADAAGVYTLPLDVGLYDLVIKPGAETGYPWQVVPGIVIDASVRDITFDATLTAPVPIEGTVSTNDGTPVGAALVRAYAILKTDGVARSVQIGEATADAEGHYRLLLPAGLD